MIKLSTVGKYFGQTQAVKSISLNIKPGEIVGLLGPNGAGKTTTLRMIAGVLPPTSGSVSIDGKTYEDNEVELKQRIGYLPENNPLYEDLSVEEHLQFWGKLKGLEGSALAEATDFAVESTGIDDVYYRIIGELSKGYKQRVGLAQAILAQPDILLLDEPTEGLDPNQRRDIQKLLSNLKSKRTVIVSSHVLGEISKLAARVVIVAHGEVVGDDTPENLVKTKPGAQAVLVELKGKGVEGKLKKLKGVDEVETRGANTFLVSARMKEDLRELLFKTAVKEKWTLLTMKLMARQLEDVFAELTEGDSS
jgi:ABC-2 type transport system ATP-binding protein